MMRYCCKIGCFNEAEFEIHAERRSGGIAGPDPYSDFTDACERHVGALLGYQVDCREPQEVYWRVIPLVVTQVETSDR